MKTAVQRRCRCGDVAGPTGVCERCRRAQLQRAATASGPAVAPTVASAVAPPIVHDVLRSNGRPLEPSVRTELEGRFQHDFSRVRIHADGRAAEAARAVNAHAFTAADGIAFDQGRFAPHTQTGRRLLVHELAHVVQQQRAGAGVPSRLELAPPNTDLERAAERATASAPAARSLSARPAAAQLVHRDLATPEPTPAPAAQPDLTEAQIREAIRFNQARYDEANTRLIQELLGGPVTGRWTADNIVAIAATQEEFGLTKDGKVGADTFEFIQREQGLEGMSTDTQNCLTMFRVGVDAATTAATPGPNGTTRIRGHHVVEARFSSRCTCSEFQYRQFIVGTAAALRPATGGVQNLAALFATIPGGQLPAAIREDGMTQCTGVNYGHREQAGEAATGAACGENQYRDGAGALDQANGCVYRGEDFPGITVNGMATGDIVSLQIDFRGEIRRNGTTIETKRWRDINENVATP